MYKFILVFLVCNVFSQDFTQYPIKNIIVKGADDARDRFAVKYITSDGTKPPQDSIFEEKDGTYDQANNNYLKRVSYFLWQYQNPRNMVFFTNVSPLRDNPYFRYSYYDKPQAQKDTFYITENIIKPGPTMVYCGGVYAPYDSSGVWTRSKDTVYVTVMVFYPFDVDKEQGLNFTFSQRVYKNTTFKVVSGKNSTNYLRVDMYQEGVFVKTVYNWDPSKVQTTTLLLARRGGSMFSYHGQVDLLGRARLRSQTYLIHGY